METNIKSMNELLRIRENIYNELHDNNFAIKYFHNDDAKFAQHYTCMYLTQDTAENISTHREKGFTYKKTGYYLDYLELVGLLQLIYIQQDCVKHLNLLFSKSKITEEDTFYWRKIRNLRNSFIGHPSKSTSDKEIGPQYSFMGRNPVSYTHFKYENYQENKYNERDPFSAINYPKINLGEMIDAYEKEAVSILMSIRDNIIKEKIKINQHDD